MDMIERVAREIAGFLGDSFDLAFDSKSDWTKERGGEPFRDINMPFKGDYLDAATAALKALREPTPEMIDRFVSRALCVSIHGEGGWSEYARNQWQAMVDGALSGEREGKGE